MMRKEKQIEEIAKIIASTCYKSCLECNSEAIDGAACIEVRSAEALYNAGYRKQIEGEWVLKFESTFPQYEPSKYQCSICGSVRTALYGYCPNCGAKMKGE